MRAVTLLLVFLLGAADAYAMRCGHKLVQPGDYKMDVLERCGEPDSVERRTAVRGNRLRHPRGALEIDRFDEVEVEDWVYNFGPRKFKQLLEFEDGVLKSIRNLDYGY